MRLPIHRWFRFSAGFSAQWVEEFLASEAAAPSRVLDPFAGSGTTLVASDAVGVPSRGIDAHPFLVRIANAKLLWHLPAAELIRASTLLLTRAAEVRDQSTLLDNDLLRRCYDDRTLADLTALRASYEELRSPSPAEQVYDILWLAITSILRETSHAGTANWQYVLPNQRKARVSQPFQALRSRIAAMAEDMALAQASGYRRLAQVTAADARDPSLESGETYDLVITSPPYPNNFDYADATRLEMTFWGEVSRWADLHRAVRTNLIRSCSQHATADELDLDDLLRDPVLDPIRSELTTVCDQLAQIRTTRAGRKSYHTMIAGYFLDLADVWNALRPLCAPKARVCFVIGDSAPYGIHVPVDRWLGQLAIAAGFRSFTFEKLRDRNTKWKNRKHRVPLKEGRLWIRG